MVDDKYSEPGAKMIISMYRKPAITNQICVSDIAPCNCLRGGRKGNCAIQTTKQMFKSNSTSHKRIESLILAM